MDLKPLRDCKWLNYDLMPWPWTHKPQFLNSLLSAGLHKNPPSNRELEKGNPQWKIPLKLGWLFHWIVSALTCNHTWLEQQQTHNKTFLRFSHLSQLCPRVCICVDLTIYLALFLQETTSESMSLSYSLHLPARRSFRYAPGLAQRSEIPPLMQQW